MIVAKADDDRDPIGEVQTIFDEAGGLVDVHPVERLRQLVVEVEIVTIVRVQRVDQRAAAADVVVAVVVVVIEIEADQRVVRQSEKSSALLHVARVAVLGFVRILNVAESSALHAV